MKPILTYGTKFYDGKKNLSIILFLIDKCNYNCKYCGNKLPRSRFKLNLDYIFNELIKLLDIIDGKIYLDVLGGEPTLHPDLYHFCQKISSYVRIKTSIYTNFSASRDMFINLISMGINIVPSWHSLLNDLDNSRFINNLIYVANHINRQIYSRVMYEPFAAKQSINAFKVLHQNHNINVEFSLLSDSKQFKVNYSNEQLSEYLKYQKLVYNENNDIYVKFDDGTSKIIGYYDLFKNKNINFRFWQCNAGKDCLYIHCDGNAYRCPKFYTNDKKPLFNIYKNKITMMHYPIICAFKDVECECDKEIMKQYKF